MKITTYNQNGSIDSEQELQIEIPDYIKKFDDSYPIMNITEDEYKLICSEEESFAKSLLKDKYEFALRYDYELYKRDIEYNFVETDNEDKTILLAQFFGISTDLLRKLGIRISGNDGQEWEKICNRINNPETEHQENLLPDIITFVISEIKDLLDFFKRRLERIGARNSGLSEQINNAIEILAVFDNSAFTYYAEDQMLIVERLFENMLKVLFKSRGVNRCQYYHILQGMDKALTKPLVAFRSTIIPPKTDLYTIRLNNDFGQGYELELSHKELFGISQAKNENIMKQIIGFLDNIDTDYQAQTNTKKSWEQNTDSLYEDFKYRHPAYNGDWSVFERDLMSTILNQKPITSYNPQQCYEKLVAINNNTKNQLDFSGKLVSDLLLLLLNETNNKTTQEGLYRTLYQFNYIKLKEGNTHPSIDKATANVLKLVAPILDDSRIINDVDYSKNEIEDVIKGILNLECVRRKICNRCPISNKFKGNFNLIFVLNIFDILRDEKFIKNNTKSKIIDKIQESPFIDGGASDDWRKRNEMTQKDKDSIKKYIGIWKQQNNRA